MSQAGKPATPPGGLPRLPGGLPPIRFRILVCDDEDLLRNSLEEILTEQGFDVRGVALGADALDAIGGPAPPDLLILDLRLPDLHGLEVLERARKRAPDLAVLIVTAHQTVDTAIRALKLGALDYIVKPFDLEDLSATIQRALTPLRLQREIEAMRGRLRELGGIGHLLGTSRAMDDARALIAQVARNGELTVLLEGETGTGKDLAARAIHFEGERASGPMVAVNCSAVPAELFESELFGYRPGAFTGAAPGGREGRFRQAHRGTLFLDEVGDVPLAVQGKLLRALETRRVEPLGGVESEEVDVRIVAATNRDLERMVESGGFRRDLFHRLEVIRVRMPTLRERREDIPVLARAFLQEFGRQFGKRFTGLAPEAEAALAAHAWPGNVRELRNAIQRAAFLEAGPLLGVGHLPGARPGSPEGAPDQPEPGPVGDPYAAPIPQDGVDFEKLEKAYLRRALEQAGGNKARAARLLGMGLGAFRYRLRRAGLALTGTANKRSNG